MNESNNVLVKEKIDKKISLCITIQIFLQVINFCIKEAFNIQSVATRQNISFIFMIIGGLIFLYNFKYVYRRRLKEIIIGIILISIVYLMSILVNIEISEYILNKAFWTIFICFPVCVYVYSLKSLKYLYENIVKTSYISLVIIGISFIILNIRGNVKYDMVLSYLTLLPVIVIINELIIKFTFKKLIMIISGVVMIIFMGSRGPLLCIIAFIILNMLFMNNSIKKHYRIILIIIMACIYMVVFHTKFLLNVQEMISQHGMYSRTLTLFTSDRITSLTGREEGYKVFKSMIVSNPFIGYGVAAEVRYFNGFPHNIFIEVFMNFGLILGTFIILYFSILFIKCLNSKDIFANYLSKIFFSCGFIPLLISDSYLTKQEFWILIGICILVNSRQHREDKKSENFICNNCMDRS